MVPISPHKSHHKTIWAGRFALLKPIGLLAVLVYALVTLPLLWKSARITEFSEGASKNKVDDLPHPASINNHSSSYHSPGSSHAIVHNNNTKDENTTTSRTGTSFETTNEQKQITTDSELLLELFSAVKAPIMMGTPIPPTRPVRVRILLFQHQKRHISFRPGPTSPMSDEVLNIVMDGLARSPHFDLFNWTVVPDFHVEPDFYLNEKPRDDIVWVADMRRIIYNSHYSIVQQLAWLVRSTLRYHQTHHMAAPHIRVVLMDFRDRIREKTFCTGAVRNLTQLLGKGNVRQVVQQVVRTRHWSEQEQFPDMGRVRDIRADIECLGSPVIQIPYTVRSDYAEEIIKMYPSFLPNTTLSSSQRDTDSIDARTPSDTIRPVDAAHFWGEKAKSNNAKLRNSVTDTLLSIYNATCREDSPVKVIADFISVAGGAGRSQVSSRYLRALLKTKIVIVAQRDGWEDHFRLFEALVGGALVMTDPMWTLPEGLVDGDSIVVYKSLKHLRKLLEYYLDPRQEHERLKIARKGWKVAMTRHRTVHWMERIFFGRTLTVL